MRSKLKIIIFAAIATLFLSLWPGHGAAATGTIYLTPYSNSVLSGNNVTLSLRINPGVAVDSVQATVTYNQSYLQFVSTSIGVFSTCVKNSGGGGSVNLVCAKLGGGTSSDSLIANITFKALVGSGSATLGITGANAASNGTYTNPSAGNAVVNFTSPAPSSPTHTSSGSSYHGTSTSPAPAASTTPTTPSKPVTISKTSAKIQFSAVTITVPTSSSAQVYIQYGTSKNNLDLKTSLSKAGKDSSINLPKLIPGTTYYYRVIAVSTDGTATKGPVKSFTTKGLTIKITVLDAHYHPVGNKVVTLHSTILKTKTDSNGVATFEGVAPGLHHLEYTAGSKNYSQTVYVADNVTTSKNTQSAPTQAAAVVLASYIKPAGVSLWVIIVPIIILVGGIAALIKRGKISMWAIKVRLFELSARFNQSNSDKKTDSRHTG